MTLHLRPANETDLPLLAQMNKRLIEDEGHPNPMTVAELQERMTSFLHGDWHIRLVIAGDAPAGYALYQLQSDPFFPEIEVVYVRQFYIERDHRQPGLGTRAFHLLMQTCFPPGCRIKLEVMAGNAAGQAFWSKLGFEPYYISLRMQNQYQGT